MKVSRLYIIFSLIFISGLLLPQFILGQGQDSSNMNPIDTESFEVMSQFFEYDRDLPLNSHTVERLEEENYVREKVVFDGIRNNRVPGYLAIPKKGNGPYPCVLLIHGVSDSKESWWLDNSFNSGAHLTKQLIDSGFAVLALDAEYHGERLANNDFESADVFIFQKSWLFRARDMIVQSVVEYRRAIDYLSTRKEIDSLQLGVIGYSMGGLMAFHLSAIDSRVKVAVASVTPILKEPSSALAVYNFAPYIDKQAFLMLMGEDDTRNYSQPEARQLYDLIESKKKDIRFFKSGHKLPEEWTTNAFKWVSGHLK